MHDLNELAVSIERVLRGPVWHGTALGQLLSEISAADAAAHPIEGAHSIWEIVLHISAWAAISKTWLAATGTPEPSDAKDWPSVTRQTPAAWKQAVALLASSHESLATAVRALDPGVLNTVVPGRKYTVSTMLRGVVEHGAYHGGQIALLTRANQARP
jgi:uncharacterized damage-inducible protein DinB